MSKCTENVIRYVTVVQSACKANCTASYSL